MKQADAVANVFPMGFHRTFRGIATAIGLGAAVAFLCPAEAFAADASSGQPAKWLVRYDREDRLLSVRVRNTPLKTVLKHIGLRTGVRFNVHSSVETAISATFVDLALERGLRRLLRSYNFLFLYGQVDDGKATQLEAVEVLSTDEPEPPPSARTSRQYRRRQQQRQRQYRPRRYRRQ